MGLTLSSATNHGYSNHNTHYTVRDPYHNRHDYARTHKMRPLSFRVYATLYSICHRLCAQRIINIWEAQYYIIELVGVSFFVRICQIHMAKKRIEIYANGLGQKPFKNYE